MESSKGFYFFFCYQCLLKMDNKELINVQQKRINNKVYRQGLSGFSSINIISKLFHLNRLILTILIYKVTEIFQGYHL